MRDFHGKRRKNAVSDSHTAEASWVGEERTTRSLRFFKWWEFLSESLRSYTESMNNEHFKAVLLKLALLLCFQSAALPTGITDKPPRSMSG